MKKPQHLGEQIRTLRTRRMFTRETLAAKTGLSVVYIRKLESGERISPSSPVLKKIARALGARVRVVLVPWNGGH